jgi:hypothetical protein
MADDANSARASVWNTIYNQYLNLTQQLEQCSQKERDATERAIAAQQEDLLDTPAPTLTALHAKLEILFEGQMNGLDAESEAKRLVLEDLHDITVDLRELAGADSEMKAAN